MTIRENLVKYSSLLLLILMMLPGLVVIIPQAAGPQSGSNGVQVGLISLLNDTYLPSVNMTYAGPESASGPLIYYTISSNGTLLYELITLVPSYILDNSLSTISIINMSDDSIVKVVSFGPDYFFDGITCADNGYLYVAGVEGTYFNNSNTIGGAFVFILNPSTLTIVNKINITQWGIPALLVYDNFTRNIYVFTVRFSEDFTNYTVYAIEINPQNNEIIRVASEGVYPNIGPGFLYSSYLSSAISGNYLVNPKNGFIYLFPIIPHGFIEMNPITLQLINNTFIILNAVRSLGAFNISNANTIFVLLDAFINYVFGVVQQGNSYLVVAVNANDGTVEYIYNLTNVTNPSSWTTASVAINPNNGDLYLLYFGVYSYGIIELGTSGGRVLLQSNYSLYYPYLSFELNLVPAFFNAHTNEIYVLSTPIVLQTSPTEHINNLLSYTPREVIPVVFAVNVTPGGLLGQIIPVSPVEPFQTFYVSSTNEVLAITPNKIYVINPYTNEINGEIKLKNPMYFISYNSLSEYFEKNIVINTLYAYYDYMSGLLFIPNNYCIEIINTTDNTFLGTIKFPEPVVSVTYIPGLKELVVSTNDTMVVMNLTDREIVKEVTMEGPSLLGYDYKAGELVAAELGLIQEGNYTKAKVFMLTYNPNTWTLLNNLTVYNFTINNQNVFANFLSVDRPLSFPSSPLTYLKIDSLDNSTVIIYNPLNNSIGEWNSNATYMGITYDNYTGTVYAFAFNIDETNVSLYKLASSIGSLKPQYLMTISNISLLDFVDLFLFDSSPFVPFTSTFYLPSVAGIYVVKIPSLLEHHAVLYSLASSTKGVKLISLGNNEYIVSNVTAGEELNFTFYINSSSVVAYLNGSKIPITYEENGMYTVNIKVSQPGVYNLTIVYGDPEITVLIEVSGTAGKTTSTTTTTAMSSATYTSSSSAPSASQPLPVSQNVAYQPTPSTSAQTMFVAVGGILVIVIVVALALVKRKKK